MMAPDRILSRVCKLEVLRLNSVVSEIRRLLSCPTSSFSGPLSNLWRTNYGRRFIAGQRWSTGSLSKGSNSSRSTSPLFIRRRRRKSLSLSLCLLLAFCRPYLHFHSLLQLLREEKKARISALDDDFISSGLQVVWKIFG